MDFFKTANPISESDKSLEMRNKEASIRLFCLAVSVGFLNLVFNSNCFAKVIKECILLFFKVFFNFMFGMNLSKLSI